VRKVYIAIAVSLVTGFSAAAIMLWPTQPQSIPVSSVDAGAYFDQSAATEQRIRALEAAVAEERNARQLLEEELLVLFAEIDSLREEPVQQDVREAVVAESRDAARAEFIRERRGTPRSAESRAMALTAAGFSSDRAAWILQREDELRVEAMQARFEAQRAGDMQAMFAANDLSESMLRAELGDLEYEQYLAAYSRPTTVAVGSVLESSPGQVAGLQVGDRIVRYDGQRVFSYADINEQQLKGEAGESVVVDILRDEIPMQIVMPRGPIGIQAGRFRGR